MYWVEPRIWRDFVVRNPLAAALAISLLIHVTAFGTWRIGKHYGWWNHQATWLLNLHKKRAVKVSAKQMQAQQQQQRQREIPLTFVEVDPAVATTEAPKNAKFYGVANSKATNPDATVEAPQPKVDGSQTHVVKAE